MKEIVFIPVAVLIVTGFVTQLADTARSTSDKALDYADKMDSAVDCAFRGVRVEECSPTLTDTNFKKDTEKLENLTSNLSQHR